MMELCPDDGEASYFFVFFFLKQFSALLWFLLEGDDHANIRQLAVYANHLLSLHSQKQAGVVAVVEQESELGDPGVNAGINAGVNPAISTAPTSATVARLMVARTTEDALYSRLATISGSSNKMAVQWISWLLATWWPLPPASASLTGGTRQGLPAAGAQRPSLAAGWETYCPGAF
jgi:hypothetical protein